MSRGGAGLVIQLSSDEAGREHFGDDWDYIKREILADRVVNILGWRVADGRVIMMGQPSEPACVMLGHWDD